MVALCLLGLHCMRNEGFPAFLLYLVTGARLLLANTDAESVLILPCGSHGIVRHVQSQLL